MGEADLVDIASGYIILSPADHREIGLLGGFWSKGNVDGGRIGWTNSRSQKMGGRGILFS
jgi:hypothetical protein